MADINWKEIADERQEELRGAYYFDSIFALLSCLLATDLVAP